MKGKFQTFGKVTGTFRQLVKSRMATLCRLFLNRANEGDTAGVLMESSLSLEKFRYFDGK